MLSGHFSSNHVFSLGEQLHGGQKLLSIRIKCDSGGKGCKRGGFG